MSFEVRQALIEAKEKTLKIAIISNPSLELLSKKMSLMKLLLQLKFP